LDLCLAQSTLLLPRTQEISHQSKQAAERRPEFQRPILAVTNPTCCRRTAFQSALRPFFGSRFANAIEVPPARCKNGTLGDPASFFVERATNFRSGVFRPVGREARTSQRGLGPLDLRMCHPL
jgi:hypothetical protein